MVLTHYRSNRKPSGGKYRAYRGKRLYEAGNPPTLPRMSERKFKLLRTKGGWKKVRLFSDNVINVFDPAIKKAQKVKFTNVIGNPANKQYVRMNVLTKGAIVQTEKGKARITNRPAQDGCVSGVLIS